MLIVRDAVEQDYEKIKQLRWDAYGEHEKKIPAKHWGVLSGSFDKIAGPEDNIQQIVAELNGEVVGTVALFGADTIGYEGLKEDLLQYPELRLLAVSTTCRGQGVAKALVQECIDRSKALGYSSMGLHTSEFMETAVQLYKNLGFVRVPEQDFVPLDDGIVVIGFRIDFE